MRTLRRTIEVGLPILGMVVVFGAVLAIPATRIQLQLLVVLLGVLMIEAGVWGLTAQVLPNERRYTALRAEVDGFIDLVRELNAAATDDAGAAERSPRFEAALAKMHASVDRMAELAGQED
ncbi:MAG: hypothetical protein D6701_01920 [Gemmatimonadetes bacterium]|nr:MAG: hypothetical protein D6701_01920 [Gemmatimonadota bacterium]